MTARPGGWRRWAPRVRGRVRVPAPPDGTVDALAARVAVGLRARGCRVRDGSGARIVLESGTQGRHSPLAFVDGGTVALATENGEAVLRYDFSTAGSLLLCLLLGPAAACLAWFTLGDVALSLFALLAPPVWLYGANYVLSCLRAPGFLARLCATVPPAGEPR